MSIGSGPCGRLLFLFFFCFLYCPTSHFLPSSFFFLTATLYPLFLFIQYYLVRQDYWDHDWLDYWDFESPWHFDGGGLDDPMPFTHPDNWWDFRMVDPSTGERWYPSPRDVLSYESEYMQVQYQNDFLSTLIPDYEPNPNLFQQASGRVRTRCRDRGWNEWWRRDRTRERKRGLMADTAEHFNEEDSPESPASSSEQKTTSELVENDLTVSFENQWEGVYPQQQQQEDNIHLAVPESCRLKNNFTKQSDQEKCKCIFLLLAFVVHCWDWASGSLQIYYFLSDI